MRSYFKFRDTHYCDTSRIAGGASPHGGKGEPATVTESNNVICYSSGTSGGYIDNSPRNSLITQIGTAGTFEWLGRSSNTVSFWLKKIDSNNGDIYAHQVRKATPTEAIANNKQTTTIMESVSVDGKLGGLDSNTLTTNYKKYTFTFPVPFTFSTSTAIGVVRPYGNGTFNVGMWLASQRGGLSDCVVNQAWNEGADGAGNLNMCVESTPIQIVDTPEPEPEPITLELLPSVYAEEEQDVYPLSANIKISFTNSNIGGFSSSVPISDVGQLQALSNASNEWRYILIGDSTNQPLHTLSGLVNTINNLLSSVVIPPEEEVTTDHVTPPEEEEEPMVTVTPGVLTWYYVKKPSGICERLNVSEKFVNQMTSQGWIFSLTDICPEPTTDHIPPPEEPELEVVVTPTEPKEVNWIPEPFFSIINNVFRR